MSKKEKTFIDFILDEFGEEVLDNHTKDVSAISTGSLSLDTSIGIGGIPRGMITEISGPEGSGKTTIALNVAKVLAKEGKKTLYIEVENLLNKNILKSVLGEDANLDNIIILTPASAEDTFIMAERGIESGEFDLVVIDSVGALASRAEKKNEFDEDTMMQIPRLIAKFLRRNVYSIRVNDIAVLFINQVRDDVKNSSRYKSYLTPGGHALKHQAAVRITLTKGEDLKRGDEKVGILTKFVVRKNKLSAPFRSFTIPIIFGEGIDYYSDFIDFAKLLGVIKGTGPYYKFDDVVLGQGKSAAKSYLINSPETLDKIKEMVYNIVNSQSQVSTVLNDLEDDEDE